MKYRRLTVAILGLAMTGALVLTHFGRIGVHAEECTCKVEVHAEECPLAACTCDYRQTGVHAEDCPLFGTLPECTCKIEVHSEGCPLYEAPETEQPDVTETPDSGQQQEQTPPAVDPAEPQTEETEAPAEEKKPETQPVQKPVIEESLAEPVVPETLPTDLEYPSGWEGYGTGKMCGNIEIAAQMFEQDLFLDARIDQVCAAMETTKDKTLISHDADCDADIIAVYAVLSGQTEDYPYQVNFDSQEKLMQFASVYWKMTQVTGVSNVKGTSVQVTHLTRDEAAELYRFDEKQKAELAALSASNEMVDQIISESVFTKLTAEEFKTLSETVPTGISSQRRAVLLNAAALAGKVSYFWGGKSLAYGWDDRWGETRTVTSEGNQATGKAQTYGLDCSGFVSWAFLNANSGSEAITTGTTNQWMESYEVSRADAKPGDIVFYHPPAEGVMNHVGIVLDTDANGPTRVVQCGDGGVQITGMEGFQHVRRPYIYQERTDADTTEK